MAPLYFLVALRSAALALNLGGRSDIGESLFAVADGIESGQATDDHMQQVAELLKSRSPTKADWEDVLAQINDDTKALLETPRIAEPPPKSIEPAGDAQGALA